MNDTLTSARLSLRPHALANHERVHQWHCDREIVDLSSDGEIVLPTEEQTKARLERWLVADPEDIIHFAVHTTESDEFIGYAHVACIDAYNRSCKIGIVIGQKEQWGRGYGTEVLRRLVDYCFEHMGVDRIGAEAYSHNPRSLRMLARAGFQQEGVSRQCVRKGDGYVDEHMFGLLRGEWVALRGEAAS